MCRKCKQIESTTLNEKSWAYASDGLPYQVAVPKCNIYFNHATCFWDCNKALKLYSISRWDKGRVKKTRDENHNWTIWQRTWKYNETWILYVSNAIALILYVNLNSDVWWLSFIYSHFIFIFTVVLYACKAQSTRSVDLLARFNQIKCDAFFQYFTFDMNRTFRLNKSKFWNRQMFFLHKIIGACWNSNSELKPLNQLSNYRYSTYCTLFRNFHEIEPNSFSSYIFIHAEKSNICYLPIYICINQCLVFVSFQFVVLSRWALYWFYFNSLRRHRLSSFLVLFRRSIVIQKNQQATWAWRNTQLFNNNQTDGIINKSMFSNNSFIKNRFPKMILLFLKQRKI